MRYEYQNNDNLAELSSLQEGIGYYFKDKNILLQALTHTTYAYEYKQASIPDNQRLEFLGDSILGMVVAEYFYNTHSSFSEGEMTCGRAGVVNGDNLAQKAKQLNLQGYLLLGKGEEKLGGRENPTNLSGALEAVIGAIYLDGGLQPAKKFIIQTIVQ